MSSPADSFYQQATALIAAARGKNQPVLSTLAPLIGRNLAEGGMLHVFGSGHSEVIAREIIGRAGGLVCVNGILDRSIAEVRSAALPVAVSMPKTWLLELPASLSGFATT